MVHEALGRVGQRLFILDADGNAPVKRLGRLAHHQGVGAVPHHQLRQQTDAQAVGVELKELTDSL